MKVLADLHSHSRFSRAVSQQMTLPVMAEWSRRKGIDLVTTADWTHPLWLKELQSGLEEATEGLYKLKGGQPSPLFLLSTEVAAIYSQGGKQRRIHLLIFAPNFAAATKINAALTRLRMNLFSDGRPILGMSARDITRLVMETDGRSLVIPAHVWTPWFSLYGSMSGFDSIEECFGDMAKFIYGIETGLSSDPAMNWRVQDLDNRSILSFSDAHSPAKLLREATVFELEELSYGNIYQAIRLSGSLALGPEEKNPNSLMPQQPKSRILYTLEFYPEEGKYHYTGHRNCGVKQTPEETKKTGVICPKCHRPLTVGVMQRVQDLAREFSSPQGQAPLMSNVQFPMDEYGVRWMKSQESRLPYVMMVPLLEIISEALNSTVSSQKVLNEYKKLTDVCENESTVLLRTRGEEIERVSGRKISEGIEKVRRGDIFVDPGFDGEFGKVKIWSEGEDGEESIEKVDKVDPKEQLGLF
ncbi:DNA helicase UvrD [Candidatus Microgenomates bacterium]|nr:DNA helicase UvrD [Candidatus Microgenomates bacterium]